MWIDFSGFFRGSLSQWPALRDSGLLETIFEDPLECQYWSTIWQQLVDAGQPDTLDYQWTFTCLANGGLTALPNLNLVSNLGFGEDATHTTVEAVTTMGSQALGDLIHPRLLLRNVNADKYSFEYHFGGAAKRRSKAAAATCKGALEASLASTAIILLVTVPCRAL